MGLSAGDTRHYRVSAINAQGTGPHSVAMATTAMGRPLPPTELTATASDPDPDDGVTQIDLAWTEPGDEGDSAITGYLIEWSADGSDPWTVLVASHAVMKDGEIELAYTHTGLGSEETRHYRVSAINDQGESRASNIDDATTADILGPVPVSARVESSGTPEMPVTSLTIFFNEPLDTANPPAKARFRVTAAEAGSKCFIGIGGLTVSGQRVTLTGLLPVIKADQAITVGYTDPTSGNDAAAIQDDDPGNDAASFALGPDGTVPVMNGSTVAAAAPMRPTDLTATASRDRQIDLAWVAPCDTGGRAINGYRIDRSPNGVTDWQELVADTDKTDVAYSDTGLKPGKTWHYWVFAINAIGTGEASDPDDATTIRGAPGQVQSLTATPGIPDPPDGTTKIDLAWDEVTDLGMPPSDIIGYRIEWSADGSDASWVELVADTGSTGVTYSDTGLPPVTTRHYRVSAINGNGTGRPSDPVRAIIDIVAPVPQSASVAANGTSLTIVLQRGARRDEPARGGPLRAHRRRRHRVRDRLRHSERH